MLDLVLDRSANKRKILTSSLRLLTFYNLPDTRVLNSFEELWIMRAADIIFKRFLFIYLFKYLVYIALFFFLTKSFFIESDRIKNNFDIRLNKCLIFICLNVWFFIVFNFPLVE